MKKQSLKRDWEMVRIFLILAVLTAGFVWTVQSLILTPVTIERIPGYKSLRSMPSSTVLHKGAVRAKILDTPLSVESLFSQEAPLPEPIQSFPPSDIPTSFEVRDSRMRPGPPQ